MTDSTTLVKERVCTIHVNRVLDMSGKSDGWYEISSEEIEGLIETSDSLEGIIGLITPMLTLAYQDGRLNE